jgi:hypothetical protein
MKSVSLALASTLVMAQIIPGDKVGKVLIGPDAVKQVMTPNMECKMKSFAACAIKNDICGINIQYHNCNPIKARTKAC